MPAMGCRRRRYFTFDGPVGWYRRQGNKKAKVSKIIEGRPNIIKYLKGATGSSSDREAVKFWMVNNSRRNPKMPESHSYQANVSPLSRSQKTRKIKPMPRINPATSHIIYHLP
jgi:hypothetical protein